MTDCGHIFCSGGSYHFPNAGAPMIRCRPKGTCSWDFILDGERHHATLEFNWLSEQGAINADGIRLEVQNHGMLTGHWTLEHAGKEFASAQKCSAFTRTFEIQNPNGVFVLRAESAFGRRFRIEHSGDVIATMYPDHPFTRRFSIDIRTQKWDLATVSFSFWLVVLIWRRAAQSGSAGGGAG